MDVLWGATGLGMMPFDLATTPAAARSGSILTGVSARQREVFVPLLLSGPSFLEVRRRLATLASRMDPRDGDGELRLLYPDGSGRRLVCRYAGGLEGSEGDDAWQRELRVGLSFLAPDPAWLDTRSVTERWVAGSPVAFFPLKFPAKLAASKVLGSVTITMPGDDDAYPLWTITGPATGFTLTNSTLGAALTVTHALQAGDTVVVDTRPDRLLITKGATNLWQYASANPELWPLRPGTNTVTLQVDGSGAGTSVTLEATPRYKTAW